MDTLVLLSHAFAYETYSHTSRRCRNIQEDVLVDVISGYFYRSPLQYNYHHPVILLVSICV